MALEVVRPTEETVDPDRARVEAFRRGDRRAFEELVRAHQGPVFAIALRFTRNRATAEDLAQRAFLQALEHVDSLQGAFRPWLLRITANLAKNHLRDHARFHPDDATELLEHAGADDGTPDAADRLEHARATHRMRTAIARLPPRQREVVLLRVDGALPFAEVGAALGITENAAKVNYHHAVRRLRELMGADDADAA